MQIGIYGIWEPAFYRYRFFCGDPSKPESLSHCDIRGEYGCASTMDCPTGWWARKVAPGIIRMEPRDSSTPSVP